MKNRRIFVTAALGLTILGSVAACKNHHAEAPTPMEMAKQGDANLTDAGATEADLNRYGISLTDSQDLNWRRFHKVDRDLIKEKLLHYIALTSQVLELDAKRGLYVTHKDRVIAKRDEAYALQKSVENFEKVFGENFEPKTDPSDQPIINKSQGI